MLENKEVADFPKPFKYTPYDKVRFSADLNENYGVNLKVCKVIILGDLCVGKTSLLNRFCHKVFDCNYRSTIGVDFQSEQINILGIPYHLQIWDTAGQERFKCIAQCYYRKAHGTYSRVHYYTPTPNVPKFTKIVWFIIVVFDLSTIRTLASCKNWLQDALEVCNDTDPKPYIFLVGSKKDLLSEEGYKNVEELAQNVAKNLKAEFWSVSAKSGENIDELFFRAAALSFDDDLAAVLSENSDKKQVRIGNDDLISFRKNNIQSKNHRKCDSSRCVNGSVK